MGRFYFSGVRVINFAPVWHTILSIIGISSLLAAILTHILTARLQRRNWINDNKKLEWRQLIDELRTAAEFAGKAYLAEGLIKDRLENNKLVSEGIVRGSEIISDRIFIANVVERHQINGKWNAIVALVQDHDDSPSAVMEFLNSRSDLHSELVKLARQDLMMVRWWRFWEWF